MHLNWALGSSDELAHHASMGSLALRLAGGAADVDAASGAAANATVFRIAHGALMAAAFLLLMPAGALLARHKWAFGDAEVRARRQAPQWRRGRSGFLGRTT